MRVGVDIGGTKMLLLAQGEDIRARWQITTGDRFSGADAEAEIAKFIQTLPTPPTSIGIAIGCGSFKVTKYYGKQAF